MYIYIYIEIDLYIYVYISGAIVQLNMGEGKTRVILPLLIMFWGSNTEDNDSIIRLTFLTQLLGEAFSYLYQYLSASILGRKLF
jgi:hypothetical protein